MGVKVNVGSGNTANITGYSVQEDSTPINPADSSGGVGQINVTVPEGSIDGSWHDTTAITRANLVTNPSFEINTTGWSTTGTGTVTLTRISADQKYGAYCAQLVCDGTAALQGMYTSTRFTVRKNNTYTASVWIKGTAKKSVRIELGEWTSAGVIVGTRTLGATIQTTGAWQRIQVSRSMGSTAATADIVVRNINASANTILVDGAQLEQSPVATDYFDGSSQQLGDLNYYWTGTVGNSISIERDGILAVNNVLNPSMEIANTPNTLLRTNLIPNPSFANNVNGWSGTNGSTVYYRSGAGRNGRRGYLETRDALLVGQEVVSPTYGIPQPGQKYMFSAYVSGTAGQEIFAQVELTDITGTSYYLVNGGVYLTNSDWTRLDILADYTVGFINYKVKFVDMTGSGSFFVDDMLMEQTVSTNTYFDGDTTDTADIIYSWSGDSNNSLSYMKTSKVIVRENLETDPSIETLGYVGTYENYVLNPGMEYANDAARSYTQRNYFMNPSFEVNSGSSSAIDVNNCYNPGLRVDGTGWATTSTTITTNGGARVVGNFASVGTVGYWRATATNAATGSIDARYGSSTTTYIPVTAGSTYTASAYMRASYVSTSTQIYIIWYTSAGAIISQPNIVDSTSLAANTYRRMSLTMTAPATAVRAVILARCYGTSVVGSTMDAGAFMMENAGTPSTTALAGNPGQYFDGAFSASGDFTYSWTTANASVSYRSGLLIPNQTNVNNGEGWQSSLYPSIGTKTFAVKSRYVGVSDYVAYAFPSGIGVANQVYTAKVTARAATGSFDLAYPVTIHEDGGLNRNLATIIPTGTTLTTTPTEYTVTFTAPSDVNANLRMLFRGGPAISQVVHYDKAFITQGDYTGAYFDGSNSTGLDSEYTTAWEDTGNINNSISNIGGIRPDAALPGNSTIIQSSLWSNNGTKSLRIIPTPVTAASNNTFAYLNSADLIADGTVSPGGRYTFVGTVRLTAAQTNPYAARARSAILIVVRPSGTEVSMIGTQPANAAGTYNIRGVFTLPEDATSAHIRLYNGDSYGGANVWWDTVGLFYGAYYGPYFDGNTTDTSELTYDWFTPGSASVSQMRSNGAINWLEQGSDGRCYRTQEQVLSGTYSLKVLLSDYLTNNSYVESRSTYNAVGNTSYTISMYVKGTSGKKISIYAFTSTTLDAQIFVSSTHTFTGGWDRVTLTFVTPVDTYQIYGLGLLNKETSQTAENIFYVDQILVEEAEEAGEWFSGSTADAGDFTYDWTGEVNYSNSIQISPTVANYTAVNCRAIHSGDWAAFGTKSLRITPVNDSTDSYVYPSTPLDEYAGKRVTVLGTSRLTGAQITGFDTTRARRIVAYVYSPTMGNNVYYSTQAPNTAGVTNHTVTFDIPADVTYLNVRLYNGADEFGGDVWWDKTAIIEVPAASEWTDGYFDGSTSDYDYNNYVWTGTTNASTSEKRVRTQETDYSLLLNDVIDLEDGAQGTTRGTINSVNYTDGMLSLAGDSRLAVFVAERSVQPYSGTLGGAFTYYLSLVGITTGFSIDSSIAGRSFKAQGWYGDMWAMMKQLCAAQRVEIALVSDNIVLRPIRTRIAENFRDISQSYSLQNTQLAERVEVYQYNNVSLNDAVVYPMPVWEWNSATKKYEFVYGSLDSNPQVYQVNADETITVEIPLNTSVAAGTIKQPTAIDSSALSLTNGRYLGTTSVYTIIDKEGLPYPAAQWIAGKGSVSVKVLEDTKTLQVKIKGAKDVDRGPFRIARASADATYAALYIVADGILANKTLLSFDTGAPLAKVGQEVGITIDNPFIDSTDEAYTALAIASAKYAHPQQTISIQTTGINRTDTSQNFRYPTFDEFATAQGVKTFAQFATDEAGVTFTAYDATWKTVTIDTFENQAFGNVNGARVQFGPAWYRIRSATLNESSVSYSAEVDTTIEDFNDDNPYLTFKEFNTRFAGKKFEDYALIPLWQS